MAFNSLKFFLFLPLIWIVFQWTPDRLRWLLLFAASIGFYAMLQAPYLLVVLSMVILITFYFGRLIDENSDQNRRRVLLWAGVTANLSMLVYFKYFPFLMQNINTLLNTVVTGVSLDVPPILVSIGLSFFIFQAISYLADIYFRMAKPVLHLGYLALYLSFFPKLLQGPIERSSDLLPQLKQPYVFNYNMARSGILLFAWGLFKKVVVADRLALFVNTVYGDVHAYTGLPLILATYFYALQIYFDFSGYTDMALGSARLFNINLTQNFNSPYLATSVADFWRRWHISFSRWILDYVFEPLQMQFRNWGKWGTAIALLITFILAGLWHGASWNYILFGLCHGIYLSAAFIYKPYQKKLHKKLSLQKTSILKIWQIIVTFNLVSFAWIFFRANSLDDSMYVVYNLFKGLIEPIKTIYKYDTLKEVLILKPGKDELVVLLISFALYFVFNLLRKKIENGIFNHLRTYVYVIGLISCVIIIGVTKNSNQFVYFKF